MMVPPLKNDSVKHNQTKLVSIVTPCFNEVMNVEAMTKSIAEIMQPYEYEYEHVWIDNASTDGTADKLREIAAEDKSIKVILNRRNFGHIRSPFHGFLQASGDVVITLSSDFQDPPELIPEFLAAWEDGHEAAVAVKRTTKEGLLIGTVRKIFYGLLSRISETDQIQNYTGFGLFDKSIVESIRRFDDPYPYFRGMLAEIGVKPKVVLFDKPQRLAGESKSRPLILYDLAMLALTSHSLIPLRISTFLGLVFSFLSFLLAVLYLVLKIFYWDSFDAGLAPMLIGQFFIGGIILFSIGIIGEYIAVMMRLIRSSPRVFEAERINFD